MQNDVAGGGGPSRYGCGLLLSLLAVFNLIDYRMTSLAVGAGYPELNPLVAALIRRGWFGLYKIGLIPAALLCLWLARRHLTGLALRLLLFTFAAYSGLMVYFGWARLAGYL